MMRFKFLILFFMGCCLLHSQNIGKKSPLYYLNQFDEYPYANEKDIEGSCFITLSDSFDYYTEPITVLDFNGNEKLKIIINEYTSKIIYDGKCFDRNQERMPLNPWLLSLSPDYLRLAFECVDETPDCYIIKLNETDLGYVKKEDSNFKIETIEDFFIKWLPLGLDFDRESNPLYLQSNSNEITPNPYKGKYRIWTATFIEMKGDWIKIKTYENEIGWIRWRNGKSILIRLYYVC